MALAPTGFKRIGHRLLFSFAGVLLVTLLMGLGSGWQLWRIGLQNDAINRNTQYLSVAQQWAGVVRANLERAMIATRIEAVMQSLPEAQVALNPMLSRLNEDMALSAALAQELQERIDAEGSDSLRGLVVDVNKRREAFVQLRAEVRDDLQMGEGEERIDGDLQQAAASMLAALTVLGEHLESSNAGFSVSLQRMVMQSIWMTAGFLLVAMLVGVALALGSARALSTPVAYSARVAREIAEGRLDQTVEVRGRDENAALLMAMQEMRDQLSLMVGEVRDNAAALSETGHRLAASNDDLAARTLQQAHSLQGTAASLVQLDGASRQNAEHAHRAREQVQEASDMARHSGEVVHQAVDKISRIHESSRQISDIVNVIDGIAFQTNILALNAAVEAARAGESGRGFAVVAGEVRNLAQRSGQAAKEIRGLIERSTQGIAEGSRLVKESGERMAQVVTAIERVAEVMREVGEASGEQSRNVSHVSHVVSELDHATHQNQSLVEMNQHVVSRLQEQAESLVGLVSRFRLAARSSPSNTWEPPRLPAA